MVSTLALNTPVFSCSFCFSWYVRVEYCHTAILIWSHNYWKSQSHVPSNAVQSKLTNICGASVGLRICSQYKSETRKEDSFSALKTVRFQLFSGRRNFKPKPLWAFCFKLETKKKTVFHYNHCTPSEVLRSSRSRNWRYLHWTLSFLI